LAERLVGEDAEYPDASSIVNIDAALRSFSFAEEEASLRELRMRD